MYQVEVLESIKEDLEKQAERLHNLAPSMGEDSFWDAVTDVEDAIDNVGTQIDEIIGRCGH